MLTRVQLSILIVLSISMILAQCQQQDKPEKRPALLSRYGRAVLPRYGKRSMGIEAQDLGSDEDVICQNINDRYICMPFDTNRFHPLVF